MPQTDGAGGYRSDPSATAPTAAPDDAPPRTQPFMPAVVTTIGIILIVVGALMMLLGAMGRPVGPRRYYW